MVAEVVPTYTCYMPDELQGFGKYVKIGETPLGLITLFILLYIAAIYGIAKVVGPTGIAHDAFVAFAVAFPFAVLFVFAWLVGFHKASILWPSQFATTRDYLAAVKHEFDENQTLGVYRDLDRLYFELLKLAMAHPQFVDRAKTSDYQTSFSGDDLKKYHLYAFAVWNICETIFDRRDDTLLYETWLPIVCVENRLHRNWFEQPENHLGFKERFREFVLHSPDLRANVPTT
jgi:hypothetical protein